MWYLKNVTKTVRSTRGVPATWPAIIWLAMRPARHMAGHDIVAGHMADHVAGHVAGSPLVFLRVGTLGFLK